MPHEEKVESHKDRKLLFWFLVAVFIALIPWFVLAAPQ
jgi:hypothetical protein